MTQEELSAQTGISIASLSRFESDRAQPAFGDVCEIALALGWPLLYFAVGRDRHGDDAEALTTELRHWGLHDVQLSSPVLLGEVRELEELLAATISDSIDPRLLEAIPALLLRNPINPEQLLKRTRARGVSHRIGWLCDVALEMSRRLPVDGIHPEAHRSLEQVTASAWRDLPKEPDYIDRLPTANLRQLVWQRSPALTRRWNVACDIPLDDFTQRASSLLSLNGEARARA